MSRIPKTIHFTWFSNDPYPPVVENCMATWKEYLPDYELIHWDMDRISGIDNEFLQQALQKRKWAFAADFVRIYALYNYGGIYLDTDVEVYKSFDPLLSDAAFIGRENSYHQQGRRLVRHLSSHCMGAEKGHPFMKICLDYYKGRRFILSEEDWLPDNLKYDQKTLPFIQKEMAELQGYKPSDRIRGIQSLSNGLKIYPYEYFDCLYKGKKAYCRHLALGGWRNRNKSGVETVSSSIKARAYETSTKLLDLMNLGFFRKL